jgi:hypothetical protein
MIGQKVSKNDNLTTNNMNKTIEFLDLEISPVTVEALQDCNVIIGNVEPETKWSLTVVGVGGEQEIIDFVGEKSTRKRER